ncbi:hypothetical protein ACFOY2_27160 [Nonomuraea purpurea]|uniref:Uncharacterized protein n=1 Tax=Nonomuraea purpurea TaxID=1849276 RepID=A0ABV8GAC6_9ACTN
MRNGVYVALVLCIGLIAALVAGITAYALGAGLVAAFAWFGAAFIGVSGLGVTILAVTGLVGSKP